MGWDEVAAQMDGDMGSLYILAEQYALTRSLPWPVSSRAEQERDALCELVYETALLERNVPGQLPKTWLEIGLMCQVPDPEQTRSLAERHCQKTGKEMPEHKNRASIFGETCYRLKEANRDMTWEEVAERAGIKWKTHACTAAATYAKQNNLPWPLRHAAKAA